MLLTVSARTDVPAYAIVSCQSLYICFRKIVETVTLVKLKVAAQLASELKKPASRRQVLSLSGYISRHPSCPRYDCT